jgi:hypothetical protein
MLDPRGRLLVALLACHHEPAPTDTVEPEPTGSTGATAETGTAPPPPPFDPATVAVAVDPRMATLLWVSWTEDLDADEAWVSWTLDGVDRASPHAPAPAGDHRQVVLGVPSSTEVPLVLHVVVDGVESTASVDATTGPLPQNLHDPLVVANDPSARPEEWTLTSVDVGPAPFFGPCYTVVLDKAGRIVWYRPTTGNRLTWQAAVSRLGPYLLVDESTLYSFSYPGPPTVSRVSLDLGLDEPIALDGNMISSSELDDGGFVFAEDVDGYQFYLTRQWPDGSRQRLWDCYAWMAPYDAGYWACAPNTTLYVPERGTVVWSMFDTSTIVEIDLASGELVREYGDYPGGYTIDPSSSRFDYQHFPNFSAEGTLMVSTHSPDGSQQWAREFEVDEATSTLHELWSVRSPDWAQYAGQVQKLPSGHVLWELGVTGIIRELEPDGTVVWEVEWPDHLVGNVTPIADLYAP